MHTHQAPEAFLLHKNAAPAHAPTSVAAPRSGWHPLAAAFATLPWLLWWDASGLDLPLAHWYGTAQGFALHDHPLLSGWLHTGARQLGWGVLALLAASIFWPVGWLRQLSRRERAWMVAAVGLSLVVVVGIKGISRTSCPWDLAVFGGTADHVSHWAWGTRDGGSGHCFPGGHASTAFAFMAVAVWQQGVAARASRWTWAVVVLAGLLLGWVQQMRGAHFFSHTLWTAWLCGCVALSLHALTWRRPAAPTVSAAQGWAR